MSDPLYSSVGYLYMHIRYGKKHENVLRKKYEGFYSAAGAKVVRVVFTFIALVLLMLVLTVVSV